MRDQSRSEKELCCHHVKKSEEIYIRATRASVGKVLSFEGGLSDVS